MTFLQYAEGETEADKVRKSLLGSLFNASFLITMSALVGRHLTGPGLLDLRNSVAQQQDSSVQLRDAAAQQQDRASHGLPWNPGLDVHPTLGVRIAYPFSKNAVASDQLCQELKDLEVSPTSSLIG